MTAQIHVDLADGILTMTLARPDKKNALTNEMYGRLADVIDHAEHDGQTRVLLVQADGDMFTAGNDVGEFAAIASGKGQASDMSIASCMRWRSRTCPSLPRSRARQSVSEPRCSSTATTCCSPRKRS